MKRILIVDDNIRVTKLLREYLTREGYETLTALDGEQAINAFHTYAPDLLILDIMMPGKSGIDVLHDIRKTSSVPIIMLTAKIREHEKLEGLEGGADDYVLKPFSPREVVARVKSLFRRIEMDTGTGPAEDTGDRYNYKEIVMFRHSNKVVYKNMQVELTAIQFQILHIMISSPGRIFSRALLVELLNEHSEIYERTIDAHIKNIRKALGESGMRNGLIQTVHGIGYRVE